MRWVKLMRAVGALVVLGVVTMAGCGSPGAHNQPDWSLRRVILLPGVCMETDRLPPPPVLPLGLPVLPQRPTVPDWLGCTTPNAPIDAAKRVMQTFGTLVNQLARAPRGQVAVPRQDLRVFSYDPASPTMFTPSDTRQPLGTSAAALQTEFLAWHKAEPKATFDLIGHSLGGDVVLLWAATYATPDELRYVHSLVTLDAPVQGYPEPLYGYLHPYLSPLLGAVAADLSSGSAAMHALANVPAVWKQGPGTEPSAVYNLGNIRDLLVPAFVTTLSGAGGVIDDFGLGPDDFNHGAVLRNANAVSLVVKLIQNANAPELAPAQASAQVQVP
jgi:pimeloyl-ACP methyl ester carboxylesterase